MPKLVKVLRVQADTVAAKTIKATVLHDETLLPRSFELGFHPVMRGLAQQRLEYGMLFSKPLGRCRPPEANSSIDSKIKHSPYEGRPHRHRFWVDLVIALKMFTSLLEVDPNFLFSSFRSAWLKRALLQSTSRQEASPEERIGLFDGCGLTLE